MNENNKRMYEYKRVVEIMFMEDLSLLEQKAIELSPRAQSSMNVSFFKCPF